jgi:hypothetical protein
MKNTTLRKEISTLFAISLVICSLVIYVITSLMKGDHQSVTVVQSSDSLKGFIEQAQSNWVKKKENNSIDLEKDVYGPLQAVENALANRYEKTLTEDRKALIKLAIVAIEKTEEQIKTNEQTIDAQFASAQQALQNVMKEYLDEARVSWSRTRAIAWATLVSVVLFFIGLLVVTYRKLKGFHIEQNSVQSQLNEETKRVEQLSGFIEAMANGNYDMHIETKSEDELSATLISMRDKLKNNFIEEQRRNWSTTGLAKIGEILRSSGNSAELYDSIIKFLVKYTNSNQGGLFILDDAETDNPFLNLVACYAFERKKFLTKKVQLGSGLVGQCFLEQERIHLTEIPEDYVRITSGLGGDKPHSILMVPLKVNDKTFGVIELASFQLYPEHVVDLIEKFAESIASTISNVKINESTKILLEQTQQQAEEMKSQEEEMRQNMEELSATQEEMHRKEREYINRIKELESELNLSEKV